MKKTLLAILLLCLTHFAQAQQYTTNSCTYSTIAGTGTSLPLGDDIVSGMVPIGFTFNFYGVNYTQLAACTNGWLTFNTGMPATYPGQTMPYAPIPTMIAWSWDDMYTTGGTFEYFTTGVAPNRVFVINYNNIGYCCTPANQATVQIQLYETSNEIRIESANNNHAARTATMGVQDVAIGATVVPGRNAASWSSAANECISFMPPAAYSINSCTYSTIPGSGTSLPLGDDIVSGMVPIGFTFSFFGTNYTQLAVCTNGWLTFNPGMPATYPGQTMPYAPIPTMIAWSWDDMYTTGGTFEYFTSGVAPNRVFVINYNNIGYCCTPANQATVQIQLYETTGEIRIESANNIHAARTATMGIQNTAISAIVVPGRNAASWTTPTNECVSFLPSVPPCGPQTVTISQNPLVIPCGGPVTLTANAPGSYDQNSPSNNTCMANYAQADLAQSFIPTSTSICGAGVFLTANAAGSGTTTIQLYDNLPNAGGVLLASGTVVASDNSWADVTWPSVTIIPGNTYYLVFFGTNTAQCVAGSTANPYAGGMTYANSGYGPFPSFDYTFHTFNCAAAPTYLWSTSATTSSINVTTSGTYSVVVTVGACSGTASVNITVPVAPTSTASQTNVSCNGGSNGTASVVASGGTGPYTYSWAPSGGTGSTASGLTAGMYTCTITDAAGCTTTSTFNITAPSALASTGSQTNVSCNGGSNGSASVSVSGGTPGYTYSWAPAGGTAATATGLTQGNYTCTITDANGCSTTTTVMLTEPSAIAATTAQTDVLCNGNTTGSATVTVSGGVSPYTYAWSSGGTGSTETGLAAGSYTCTITDANGCTSTSTVAITEPSAISVTSTSVNVTCNGGTDGSIDLTVSGGVGPYTFDWNSGAFTTEDLTNIPAGTYAGVLTDANGCTSAGTTTITEPAVIADNGVVTNATGCTTNDGSIDLSTSGGTAPFTYLWSNTMTTEDLTGLDAGVFSVTITDANGCTQSASFTVTEPGAPAVTYSEPMDTACQSTQAPFTLTGETPAGGTWSGPGVTGNTFDPMTANLGMNVIVYSYTDAGGCSASASDSIWVDLCLDVNTMAGNTFSLYPNPTTGKLNITTNGDNATIIVLDALGQQVMSVVSNSTNTEIDLSKHADGLYFVRVLQNGNYTTQRVTVAK